MLKKNSQAIFYLITLGAALASAVAPVPGFAQQQKYPFAAAELANLSARFRYHQQMYERFAATALQNQLSGVDRGSRVWPYILSAHDRGQFSHVIGLAQDVQLVADSKVLQKDSIFVLMALSSAYFHERSFRSSAELCNILADPIQRWSASGQVRRFAAQCSFAVLKTLAVWGRRVDGVREFGAFLMHPGFARPQWHGSLAASLVAAARSVTGESGKGYSQLLQASEEQTFSTVAPTVVFVAAVVAIESNDLEQGLRLLEIVKAGRDETHAAMAHWLAARIQSDLGRRQLAAVAHETAAELLTEQLRRATFTPLPNPIEIGLFGRMIFDSSKDLAAVGTGDRAQSILANLGALASQMRQLRPELPWLEALEDAAGVERSKLAAQLQSVPSMTTLASIKGVFARTIRALDGIGGSVTQSQKTKVESDVIELTAQRLGLRSRALDALLVGRGRLTQADADLDALGASQTRMLLQSAARDPLKIDTLIWLRSTYQYFLDYVSQSAFLLRDMQLAAADRGNNDESWNFIQNALAQVVSGSELSLRQNDDFVARLSPFGDTSNPIFEAVLSLPGRVSFVADKKTSDIQRIAALGHVAFVDGAVAGRAEKVVAASESMLQRTVDLIESGLMRSKVAVPDRYDSYLSRGLGCLSGLRDAFGLMQRVVQFERSRAETWNKLISSPQSALNNQLVAAANQRAKLADTLRAMGSIDSSAVLVELRLLLRSRQNSLKEAMLLAFSAGAMASEAIERDLQEVDKQLSAASRALDEAAAAGNLR